MCDQPHACFGEIQRVTGGEGLDQSDLRRQMLRAHILGEALLRRGNFFAGTFEAIWLGSR